MAAANYNCMICWPNYSDSGTLTDPNGAWSSAAPLSNLQNRFLSKAARTNDLSTFTDGGGLPYTAAININFGAAVPLSTISFVKHNLSLGASVRTVFWTGADMTTPVWDSGYLPVWPRWFDTLSLQWGMSNFWTGQIQQEQIPFVPSIYLAIPTDAVGGIAILYAQYATIYIYDPLNPSGFLQISRMYASSGYQPTINMSWGASIQWNDPSVVSAALDGTEYFESRPMFRSVNISLDNMSKTEGVSQVLLMTRMRGITGDVLFIWDPTDTQSVQQLSFIGRFDGLSALAFPTYPITSMPLKIKELV